MKTKRVLPIVLQAFNTVAWFFRCWVPVFKLHCPVLTAAERLECALIQVREKKWQLKSRFPEWWTASEDIAEASGPLHSLTPETGVTRTVFIRNFWDLVNSLWMLKRTVQKAEHYNWKWQSLMCQSWGWHVELAWQPGGREDCGIFFLRFDVVLNEMLLLACVKELHAMVWAVSCTNVGWIFLFYREFL